MKAASEGKKDPKKWVLKYVDLQSTAKFAVKRGLVTLVLPRKSNLTVLYKCVNNESGKIAAKLVLVGFCLAYK
mgnify:CR=1 FL=1